MLSSGMKLCIALIGPGPAEGGAAEEFFGLLLLGEEGVRLGACFAQRLVGVRAKVQEHQRATERGHRSTTAADATWHAPLRAGRRSTGAPVAIACETAARAGVGWTRSAIRCTVRRRWHLSMPAAAVTEGVVRTGGSKLSLLVRVGPRQGAHDVLPVGGGGSYTFDDRLQCSPAMDFSHPFYQTRAQCGNRAARAQATARLAVILPS